MDRVHRIVLVLYRYATMACIQAIQRGHSLPTKPQSIYTDRLEGLMGTRLWVLLSFIAIIPMRDER